MSAAFGEEATTGTQHFNRLSFWGITEFGFLAPAAIRFTILACLLLLAVPKPTWAGSIYVTNFGNGTVGEYNSSTGAVINAHLITGLGTPFGVALDGAGHLYVVSDFGKIGEYNASTGAAINANLITDPFSPHGLALNGGNLYVVQQSNGTLGEYNASTGAAIHGSLITGLATPTFDAFAPSAVPEPSSITMLGTAIAVFGFGAWMRRRRGAVEPAL